jgi:hypothetical protein
MTLADEKFFTADNIHSAEVAAVFSTRNGGVSGQTFEYLRSLNFQFNVEDEKNVAENYKIIAAALGFRAEEIFGVHQIHSDKIFLAEKKPKKIFDFCEKADAIITNKKNILLTVRIADCVPILLHDTEKNAIAAIHAGWRGTLAQIAQKTIRRMTEEFSTDPTNIRAAIGASIGICCYEVDENFHLQFKKIFGEKIEKFFSVSSEKIFCNLSEINKFSLTEAGVREKNISALNLCTKCHPELFFSHRKSGKKRGTLAAFIGMKN